MDKKKTPPPPPPKKHEPGIGMDLVGSPEKLIKQMLRDKDQVAYTMAQLTQEGPPHKQIQNAVLLRQLAKLIKETEKKTRVKFELQDGHDIISKTPDGEINIPLSMPKASVKGLKEATTVLDKAAKGPEHEMLMNALVLHVIEWATKSIAKIPA